jgi:GT2 family glycosyltransferase
MVIKRDCFKKVGLLDLNFPLSCDYEWALRLHLNGGVGVYESRLVSNFSLGGVSTRSDFQQIYQNLMIMRRHGLINFKTVIPYIRRVIRYSIGSLVRNLLPKSIHRKLKNILLNKKQYK